jgi:hypothetical protein
LIVARLAGSRGSDLEVTRWALAGGGLGEQLDGEAGIARSVAVLGVGQDGDGLADGVGREGKPSFGGQRLEDGSELGGGVTGEGDDRGKAGGQLWAGVQHCPQRVWLARQDDGELVAVKLSGFGQELVQAAEDVLAVIGQVVPGVRSGDHHQVARDLDRLVYLCRGVPGCGADQVSSGDLDQVAVMQDS